MHVYLAGCYGRPFVITEQFSTMDFYIGAPQSELRHPDLEECYGNAETQVDEKLYILESFYYVEKWMNPYIRNKVWNFMLDSGAFTFMDQKRHGVKSLVDSASVDWTEYVCRYADFIIEHDIDLFFELDIDVVVGMGKVAKLRELLETRTGKRSIPVWHKSRGLENWKDLCKEYDYVAIGGIVSGEIKRRERKFFNPMWDIAHAHNTRVHGLGLSPSGMNGAVVPSGTGLKQYRFDSVDSTNWTMGNRAGFICYFDGTTMKKLKKPQGTKMKAREAAKHNFREWVKYQRYLKHAGWRLEP